jgi:aromatic amino acid aminotransferase I
VGSSSALDIAYRMLTERGDSILSEEYTYVTAIETAAPMEVQMIGVKMDEQGLLPSSMDEILSTWDAEAQKSPRPKVLYTVPSGQNPTGATQSLKRRKEVYRVAQKHDIFILEDEPYYFLQMQPYTGNAPDVPPPASHTEFIKSLVPSLLSLDTDGRVMRLDSFSKIVAPGSRTGWITAPEQIVERFTRHNEVSVQTASGFSQVILYKLLDDTWGHAGFLDWLINLRLEYTQRRDVLLHACEVYLPKEVVEWSPPMAGMFVSLFLLSSYPTTISDNQ